MKALNELYGVITLVVVVLSLTAFDGVNVPAVAEENPANEPDRAEAAETYADPPECPDRPLCEKTKAGTGCCTGIELTEAAVAPDEYVECGECGSNTNVIPIVYGHPGPELREAAERGEVFLGGCVITEDDPLWYCRDCEHSW